MKKRIFLFTTNIWGGGQARFISRLIQILKDRYDLMLILFNDQDIIYPIECEHLLLDDPEVKTNRYNKYSLTFKRVDRYRAFIKDYKPFASLSFGDAANVINLLSGTPQCKTLVSIRGYQSVRKVQGQGLKAVVFRSLLKRSGKVVCVSQVMAEALKEILRMGTDRIDVLYNAYDLDEIQAVSREATELDAWLAGNQVIVTVGAFRKEKGYWHLLKALALLKKRMDHVKLLHIGPDFEQRGAKFQKLVRDLGLEDEVVLLGFHENPYKYCAKSKVFVLSSVSEGFPNALVEAMACGIPVVAADCLTGPGEILKKNTFSGSPDSIQYADYGLLVPPLNIDENYDPEVFEDGEKNLAEALYCVLNDQALADAYAAKAKERAADFSYERCRRQAIRIIEE